MKNDRNTIRIIEVCMLFFLAWSIFSISKYNGGTCLGKNANLLFFMLISVLFIVVWFFAGWVNRYISEDFFANERLIKIISVAVTLMTLLVLAYNYFVENEVFPVGSAEKYIRHKFDNTTLLLLLLFILLFVAILHDIDFNISKRSRIIVAIAVALISALSRYSPNPFADMGGGIFHNDAYTTSIYNSMHGIPYSDINFSIYGHYAIFYAPLAKLIGGVQGVEICISIITFITVYFMATTGVKKIKDDKVFILYTLSLLLVSSMFYVEGDYLQLYPHRCLFPAIIVYWCSCLSEKEKISVKDEIIGLALCALSNLWNFEVGIVCTLSYYIFIMISKKSESDKYSNKRFFIDAFISIIGIVLSVILSMVIANIYNYALGGGFIGFKDYVYPLLSDEYNVDGLSVPLYSGLHMSIVMMAVFMIVIVMIAEQYLKNSLAKDSAFIALVAVNGMGVFTYYINRTAYANISISYFQVLLVIVLLLEQIKGKEIDGKLSLKLKKSFEIIVFGVLCVLTLQSVVYTGACINKKIESTWKMQPLREAVNTIKLTVPENTIAYGVGACALYEELGWDGVLRVTDAPDINVAVTEYVNNEIQKHEYALIHADIAPYIPVMSEYDVIEKYYISNCMFALFKKK